MPVVDDELALLKAAYAGNRGEVQSLIAAGVNVNVQSNEFHDMGRYQDVTPLMCAADQGHLEIVRFLLAHGANHAGKTNLSKSEGGPGTQALHFAAAAGYEPVVIALLDAGADPNAEGKFGRTPLTWALCEGELACAKLLLSRGASPSIRSKREEFEPPLSVLANVLANAASKAARDGKLDPGTTDSGKWKELLFELLQMLLSLGADPNAAKSNEGAPLLRICRRMPEDIQLPFARLLLEKGADPDAVNGQGLSPLLMAVMYRSTSLAGLLLDYPVDVNRATTRGTALDIVVGDIESLQRDISRARTEDIRVASEESLRDSESFRDLLITRGGKRKSEIPAALSKASKPENRTIASEFLTMLNSGDAEWALLAVKAPFNAVSDAYFKFSKAKSRQENVPLIPAANGQEIPAIAAIVKTRNSPWTIILRTVFYVRSPDLKHVAAAAEELSTVLNTHALTWAGTDESEFGQCELFEKGESLAKASGKKTIALLTSEDIALPACYPFRTGDKTGLAVEKSSLSMVERADLIPYNRGAIM